MSDNTNLHRAKVKKDDEWPTPVWMIERIFDKATTELKGMSVYCPCDGPESEFTRYFIRNFHRLGLRSLVCTSFSPGGRGALTRYDHKGYSESSLVGDGDFRSDECCALRDEADIIITNPPWSLTKRYFIPWLLNKEYIFIAHLTILLKKQLWEEHKVFCLGSSLRFPKKKGSRTSPPAGCVFGSINIPCKLSEGIFGKSSDPNKGVMSTTGYIMYNNSSLVPIYVPIGTRLLVPLSAIAMERLYSSGFIPVYVEPAPVDIQGKYHFGRLIIEKVREVDHE